MTTARTTITLHGGPCHGQTHHVDRATRTLEIVHDAGRGYNVATYTVDHGAHAGTHARTGNA